MSGIVGYVYYSQKCELNTYCDKEFAGNDVEIKSCKNHLEFGELIFANPLTKEALREDISNIKNPDKYVEAVNRGIDIFKNGKMSCKKKIVFSGLMIGLIFSTSKGLIKSNKNDGQESSLRCMSHKELVPWSFWKALHYPTQLLLLARAIE
jgi:hypothetical protein